MIHQSSANAKHADELMQEAKGIITQASEDMVLLTRSSEDFRRITESSNKITVLVEEIAVASKDQANGINRLNSSIAEMEQVIQVNAGNAEESAEASDDMNAQAENMKLVVRELRAVVDGNFIASESKPHPVDPYRPACA